VKQDASTELSVTSIRLTIVCRELLIATHGRVSLETRAGELDASRDTFERCVVCRTLSSPAVSPLHVTSPDADQHPDLRPAAPSVCAHDTAHPRHAANRHESSMRPGAPRAAASSRRAASKKDIAWATSKTCSRPRVTRTGPASAHWQTIRIAHRHVAGQKQPRRQTPNTHTHIRTHARERLRTSRTHTHARERVARTCHKPTATGRGAADTVGCRMCARREIGHFGRLAHG